MQKLFEITEESFKQNKTQVVPIKDIVQGGSYLLFFAEFGDDVTVPEKFMVTSVECLKVEEMKASVPEPVHFVTFSYSPLQLPVNTGDYGEELFCKEIR